MTEARDLDPLSAELAELAVWIDFQKGDDVDRAELQAETAIPLLRAKQRTDLKLAMNARTPCERNAWLTGLNETITRLDAAERIIRMAKQRRKEGRAA